jgi:hypothetical protein
MVVLQVVHPTPRTTHRMVRGPRGPEPLAVDHPLGPRLSSVKTGPNVVLRGGPQPIADPPPDHFRELRINPSHSEPRAALPHWIESALGAVTSRVQCRHDLVEGPFRDPEPLRPPWPFPREPIDDRDDEDPGSSQVSYGG